jgi:hypothetical protein
MAIQRLNYNQQNQYTQRRQLKVKVEKPSASTSNINRKHTNPEIHHGMRTTFTFLRRNRPPSTGKLCHRRRHRMILLVSLWHRRADNDFHPRKSIVFSIQNLCVQLEGGIL